MSNFNLNKVVLGGRLTAAPELKQTAAGVSVLSFCLAVNRRAAAGREAQTDFIRCRAWRQTAEFIAKYFQKGSAICVCGSIETGTWTDRQGQKRYDIEVVVDEAAFVDSKREDSAPVSDSPYLPEAYQPSDADLSKDDDLPF